MTEQVTTPVQARLTAELLQRLDEDVELLHLKSRSAAVREGLKLLHRQARETALAAAYDRFYADTGGQAPISDIAAIGDQLAAETMDYAPSKRG